MIVYPHLFTPWFCALQCPLDKAFVSGHHSHILISLLPRSKSRDGLLLYTLFLLFVTMLIILFSVSIQFSRSFPLFSLLLANFSTQTIFQRFSDIRSESLHLSDEQHKSQRQSEHYYFLDYRLKILFGLKIPNKSISITLNQWHT